MKIDTLLAEKEELVSTQTKLEEVVELLKTKRNLQKRCSAWKAKAQQSAEKLSETREDKIVVEERVWLRIREVEKENAELQELLDLCEKDTVSTFEDGKFSDAVRAVIMSLLKLNISTRNICPAIKTVLEGLANIQTDRLPSYGTVNHIMYEAKCLALIEAGKASLRDKQGKAAQNVLMNDGTSKLKKKYKTTIISTSEGVKTFGLQLLATETSESLLEANARVLNDVAKVVSRVEGRSEEVLNELLGTVTGTMSDRAEVMKKFNKLLNDY